MSADFLPPAARPGRRNHIALWAALVVLLTLGQFAATVFIPRSLSLTLINDVIEFLLMLSTLLVFLVNASASPRQTRLFWMLLAASWGVTVVSQLMWMYFDLVLRKEAPNPFVGDILLFLSSIPFLAALLLQPHLDPVKGRESRGTVDFLLLLLWWLNLYLFFVVPWQYIVLDEAKYGSNYNRLNGLLDIVLLLTLAFLWSRCFGRWKWFYAILFGAQLLKTASGYLANQAIDKHVYYPGSWYDAPLSVALASFTLVGLFGLTLAGAPVAAKKSQASVPVTRLGMLAVLSLPVMGAWAVLNRNSPAPVTKFRELVTRGIMLVMTFLVFAKLHRMRIDLAKANLVLQEASATDPLTGARNRRFFDTTIAGDANHALRSYEVQELRVSDLIFYMVDLDDFKEVNDRYGHGVGDQVLLEVTRRINSVIRSSDVLVRWGGDEFLIVSRYSNRADAATFALRILTAVGDPKSAEINAAAIHLRQTCSIGWAAFPWDPGEPKAVPLEAVLGLADRGVFEAKRLGKDRAIGVLPSDKGTKVLFVTAGDRVSTYCVRTVCVVGPSQASNLRTVTV
jgi:diguanylate cyclase (GGDEF)-like protein